MQLNERVAGRILDAASVQMEHGNERVANMLEDEANALRAGQMFSMVNYSSEANVGGVDSLRDHARDRGEHDHAVDGADEIIAAAWLAEGHAEPSQKALDKT